MRLAEAGALCRLTPKRSAWDQPGTACCRAAGFSVASLSSLWPGVSQPRPASDAYLARIVPGLGLGRPDQMRSIASCAQNPY